MEKNISALGLLDLMICPGFCVKDHKILQVNEAAKRCFLEPGTDVSELLVTGQQEYAAFQEGCLYLTLKAAGEIQSATVTRVEDLDVFILDEAQELQELQVLALAAQALRLPLSNVMLSAEQLSAGEENRECKARLLRGTAQLQRMVCNMSDALRYLRKGRMEIRNITALVEEIFEKSRLLAQEAGISLSYQGPREDIFTLTDGEQLERAIYNLISNSLKFTPRGGTVTACLRRKGKLLQLTVEDSGSGIADGILQNVFTRYLRQPSLEDSRFGLGLGMVLVRAAARTHGGTVLIDRPQKGARISLTLSVKEKEDSVLCSPVLTVDYAGERDHGLLELSENLPADLYLPD